MELQRDDLEGYIGKGNAEQIVNALKYIPHLTYDVFISPINSHVVRITFNGVPSFKFVKKYHGYSQSFLIAFSRADNGLIIYSQQVTIDEENCHQSVDITALVRTNQWTKIRIGEKPVKYSQYLNSLDTDMSNIPQNQNMLEDDSLPVIKCTVIPLDWPGGRQARSEKLIDLKQIVI